jgi:anti-anti-sigma factor
MVRLTTNVQEVAQGIRRLGVAGPIDSTTYDLFEDALRALIEDGPRCVQVDLARVPQISSVGAAVLMNASAMAEESDVALTFHNVGPSVQKVLELLGMAEGISLSAEPPPEPPGPASRPA